MDLDSLMQQVRKQARCNPPEQPAVAAPQQQQQILGGTPWPPHGSTALSNSAGFSGDNGANPPSRARSPPEYSGFLGSHAVSGHRSCDDAVASSMNKGSLTTETIPWSGPPSGAAVISAAGLSLAQLLAHATPSPHHAAAAAEEHDDTGSDGTDDGSLARLFSAFPSQAPRIVPSPAHPSTSYVGYSAWRTRRSLEARSALASPVESTDSLDGTTDDEDDDGAGALTHGPMERPSLALPPMSGAPLDRELSDRMAAADRFIEAGIPRR